MSPFLYLFVPRVVVSICHIIATVDSGTITMRRNTMSANTAEVTSLKVNTAYLE